MTRAENLLSHIQTGELSEWYGPVFTFWFDSCPAVVVCGAEAMREALIGHGNDFSGRYLIPVIKKVSDGYDCGRKPEHPVETQAIEKVALRILYTDVTSTMLPEKSVPGFRT
ncbi:cytochrome P450 2C40-like isoform X2 [Hypanus sabinus]|uniref:cytochrome P450 2C40-like isoform X2 n=1 Tax=Hypanus sabinus TaxID=79690 RepID=UPI0028C50DDB|nr:cytochrome P450 2C40-like isoform X2 [Hypanus sabinus]